MPDIKAALQEQYPGATISRITHGMQGTQQAYVVEYTAQDGTTGTAYVLPNGTFAPDAAGTPDAAASPAVTDNAAASPEAATPMP